MNWEEIRVNAAIAAMQGLLINASYTMPYRKSVMARLAVEQADALVNELRSLSASTNDEH